MKLGGVHFTEDDLDALADVLADRVRARLANEGDWLTTTVYAEAGHAPSVEAARKRATRLEAKGSADVSRRGGKLYLRVPHSGTRGLDNRGETSDT